MRPKEDPTDLDVLLTYNAMDDAYATAGRSRMKAMGTALFSLAVTFKACLLEQPHMDTYTTTDYLIGAGLVGALAAITIYTTSKFSNKAADKQVIADRLAGHLHEFEQQEPGTLPQQWLQQIGYQK
tara:strand:+ start:10 stop:387 length:378 start_codon:yes stop_codon:yes gene_type:complete